MTAHSLTDDETSRDRLLSAAISAFSAKGFHGTKTRDIANAAGMSPAGVYVHYSSKEELLYSITEAGHRGVLTEIRAASSGAQDPTSKLIAIVRTFAVWHAERHTRARVVNYELAALTSEHHAVIAKMRRQITREFELVVEAGQNDGSFNVDDVRMTAATLISLGIDVSRWYRESMRINPEQLANHHEQVALRVVGARRRRRRPTGADNRVAQRR